MSETEPNQAAMKLQHTWILYYDEQTPQKGQQQNDYSDRLKPLGTFSTVQVCLLSYYHRIEISCRVGSKDQENRSDDVRFFFFFGLGRFLGFRRVFVANFSKSPID
jgi:hypothetical protein